MSPTAPSRLTVDATLDKDEGISDEEDPAELRVLLDLNEQEASQLRRKVEELEESQEANKKQIKELQEKCKTTNTNIKDKLTTTLKTVTGANGSADKIKQKDKEISELKMKINEKDRAMEKLKTDMKVKGGKVNDTSVDLQNTVDHKRQVEMVEQEAAILRGKVVKLESECESISTENKKLTVQVARMARKDSIGAAETNGKTAGTAAELIKAKDTLAKVEKENSELQMKLKNILEVDVQKLPARIPKKFTDLSTKGQLQKIVTELEDEIKEMRAIVVRCGANDVQKLEASMSIAQEDVKRAQEQLDAANIEISKFCLILFHAHLILIIFTKQNLGILKTKKDASTSQATKLAELESTCKDALDESKKFKLKVKNLEEKISKQDGVVCYFIYLIQSTSYSKFLFN